MAPRTRTIRFVPDFFDDNIAYATAQGIGDLIPAELEKSGLQGVCFGGVMPGAEVAFDECGGDCPGLWWTRPTTLFPSLEFPQPDQVSHNRRPIVLAQGYEVGLVRSLDVDDSGQPTSGDVLTNAARIQAADMRALLRVICAYFRGNDTAFVVGPYTPYGPQGACVGGSWLVTAGADGNG